MSLRTTVTAIESYEIADHPTFEPLYDEDEQLHVEAIVFADAERNDYGVPGSPVWYSAENADVDIYTINGVEYTPKRLRAKFGKCFEDELAEICIEAAYEKNEWEQE